MVIKIIAWLTSIILTMLPKLNALPVLPYSILTTALETELEGDSNLPSMAQLMYKIGRFEHWN